MTIQTGHFKNVTQKLKIQRNSKIERHKATLAKLLAAIHRLQDENRTLRERVEQLERQVETSKRKST
jgi:hypothetical protein